MWLLQTYSSGTEGTLSQGSLDDQFQLSIIRSNEQGKMCVSTAWIQNLVCGIVRFNDPILSNFLALWFDIDHVASNRCYGSYTHIDSMRRENQQNFRMIVNPIIRSVQID